MQIRIIIEELFTNKTGNYKQAIKDFNTAIRLKFMDAKVYHNRGIAYNGVKDYRAAIEDFNTAIGLKFMDAKVYHNRGIAYNGIKNYKVALTNFSKAIEINPDYAEAYNDFKVIAIVLGLNGYEH